MNTGPDPTPLDNDEAALARRLRALPGGDPPPELDARIRAQAHAAVAAPRPPLRPWVWGLSTAAAAVLAVGLLWQAGLPPTQQEVQYRQPAAPAPAAVEHLLREDDASATGAAAAQERVPAADLAPAADGGPAADRAPAGRAPATEPGAAQQPRRERGFAADPPRQRAASQAGREQPTRKALTEPAEAPPPPPSPPAPAARVLEDTQQAVQPPAPLWAPQPQAAPAPPASLMRNAALPPDQWLARIEQLLERDRDAEALANLRLFRDTHPDHTLPPRLQRLLDNAGHP